MNKLVWILLIFVITACPAAQAGPRVEMNTSKGTMIVELYPDQAPNTVANFLKYVEIGFFDDLIFHRVIDDRIIQTGGYDLKFDEKETFKPIRNEASNGLKNERGTVAMARLFDPHSADSQFFINLDDNSTLDHEARTFQDYGYCVFGKVIEGMDVADAIGDVKTHEVDGVEDVPVEPVILNSVKLLNAD